MRAWPPGWPRCRRRPRGRPPRDRTGIMCRSAGNRALPWPASCITGSCAARTWPPDHPRRGRPCRHPDRAVLRDRHRSAARRRAFLQRLRKPRWRGVVSAGRHARGHVRPRRPRGVRPGHRQLGDRDLAAAPGRGIRAGRPARGPPAERPGRRDYGDGVGH